MRILFAATTLALLVQAAPAQFIQWSSQARRVVSHHQLPPPEELLSAPGWGSFDATLPGSDTSAVQHSRLLSCSILAQGSATAAVSAGSLTAESSVDVTFTPNISIPFTITGSTQRTGTSTIANSFVMEFSLIGGSISEVHGGTGTWNISGILEAGVEYRYRIFSGSHGGQAPGYGSNYTLNFSTQAPCTCPGDLDQNGEFSLSDVAYIIQHWNQVVPVAGWDGDLDESGRIGVGDIAMLIDLMDPSKGRWGSYCD
ncbi:MAG TPA: hypothetical protein VG797_07970 [Phycisphaerales bacterium]|nr:hypothetical protein [Phycisphaerales bacterium]